MSRYQIFRTKATRKGLKRCKQVDKDWKFTAVAIVIAVVVVVVVVVR